MPKLKDSAITKADLDEYLQNASDFAFEMQTLSFLNSNDFSCRHSGSYIDPVTNKPRQFDIRANYKATHPYLNRWFIHFALAIECKNLRDNFPLLVSCVPRARNESYHEIITAFQIGPPGPFLPISLRIQGCASYRQPEQFVGKCCAQAGRALSNEFVANDSEFYERWAQSLASCVDLVQESITSKNLPREGVRATVVLPIVVVPNNRLWIVKYNDAGQQISDAEPANSVAYYVGHKIPAPNFDFTASHVDILTSDGLEELVNSFSGRTACERCIPEVEAEETLAAKIKHLAPNFASKFQSDGLEQF